jgi:hypothetical protein
MNERDLADHTYGKPGWSKTVDDKLERIERGVKKLCNDVMKAQQDDSKRYKKLELRVEELEGLPRDGEDDEEITGVQSVDELRRKARGHRARAKKMRRSIKYGIPALITGVIAAVEMIHQIVKALH